MESGASGDMETDHTQEVRLESVDLETRLARRLADPTGEGCPRGAGSASRSGAWLLKLCLTLTLSLIMLLVTALLLVGGAPTTSSQSGRPGSNPDDILRPERPPRRPGEIDLWLRDMMAHAGTSEHDDWFEQHAPGSVQWYQTTDLDMTNPRPKGSGRYVDISETEGTTHQIARNQTRWISFRGVTASSPELHAIADNMGTCVSPVQIENNRSGSATGFANTCIAYITDNGVQLLSARELPCVASTNGTVWLRIWATLDKLVPKQVELGCDRVLDPVLARSQLIQFVNAKDIWFTAAQEIAYAAADQRGAVTMATVLTNSEKVRIGPRRLVGMQDGDSTHFEENKAGKVIAIANSRLTLYTAKRVEIRATSWKMLEAILVVARSFANEKNSEPGGGNWCANMVPFGSDAMEAYRKSDTCVMLDFGTMRGISIPAIYDLTVGLAAVWHVAIQQLDDRDSEGKVLLTRTIVKVTAADAEGQIRLLSLDGSVYDSLGSTPQVIKATIWMTNEQALVPADMKQFTMTKYGMARVGNSTLEQHDPIAQLRKMDEDQLSLVYAPHAAKRAARMASLQTDIAAVDEKRLAEQHGVEYQGMPIDKHTLIIVRNVLNPKHDITLSEIVYHGQTVYSWATSVVTNMVDPDDDEWSAMAAAANGGQVPDDCEPGVFQLYRQRGQTGLVAAIPVRSSLLTQMRDHMARIELEKGPQCLYAVLDFTGAAAVAAAKKMVKLNIGAKASNNTSTADPQGSKKPKTEAHDQIAEHLKSQLQRAAVITAAFPQDVKTSLRMMAAQALNPNSGGTVVNILEYLENQPTDAMTQKHPTLDMYDTDVICAALEMAVAAPFDTSGGSDMYDSWSRVNVINRMTDSELRDRTTVVLEYLGTYSNALTAQGPPTPAAINVSMGGDLGGTNAKLTERVYRTGAPAESLCSNVPDWRRSHGYRWAGRPCLETPSHEHRAAAASWISPVMDLLRSDRIAPSIKDFINQMISITFHSLRCSGKRWQVILPNPHLIRCGTPDSHTRRGDTTTSDTQATDYLEMVRTSNGSDTLSTPLIRATLWVKHKSHEAIKLTTTYVRRGAMAAYSLLASYKLTIFAVVAASGEFRALPQPAALTILAIMAWRQNGTSKKHLQQVGAVLRSSANTVARVTQSLARHRGVFTLGVLTLLAVPAQADLPWQGESAYTSLSIAALPAACAAAESYDCAGRWVDKLGEVNWEDMKQNHGDEEYWSHMGWDDQYYGDAMLDRGRSVGLRIIAQNAGRRLFKAEQPTAGLTKLQLLVAKMTVDSVDIAILHEPGMYRKTDQAISKELGDAWRHIAVRRNKADTCGGLVVVYRATIEPAIEQAMRSSQNLQGDSDLRSKAGARYDSDRLVALEFCNPRLRDPPKGYTERKDRLLLVLVYGYNTASGSPSASIQWGENEQSQLNLMTDTRTLVEQFRSKYPKASVVLAGDLNSAEHVDLDSLEKGISPASLGRTNHDADLNRALPGHTMMSTLRSMGLCDSFREHHPYTKAVTRWPQGEQKGNPKRLDAIWMTKELVDEVSARSGIRTADDVLDSDHRMHYVDICLDVANRATNRQVMWSRTKETKISPLKNLNSTSLEVREYQDKLAHWEPELHLMNRVTGLADGRITSDADWDSLMNEEFKMMNRVMLRAGVGTILQQTTIISPNFISKIPDMEASDWDHFLRRRRLRAVEDAIARNLGDTELDRRLARIPEPVRIVKTKGEEVPQFVGPVLAQARTSSRHNLRSKVLRDIKHLNTWLDAADRKVRNTRSKQYNEETRAQFAIGKVSRTVRSVFHKHKALKAKVWLNDKAGALISSPEAVSKYVGEFLQDWMATKAPVTSRFKDIEATLDWDLSEMAPEHKQAVDTFYSCGGKDRHYYADKEELWEGTLEAVTTEELSSAINSFATGKATGPSQISIDLFKWMPPPLRMRVQQFLSECVRRRRFPPEANAAKMWLVPKNEAGITDLGQTRPIALMETMCKLYERVLCDRILNTMMTNNMIDRCQHGSIPEGTTNDAMFNLAGVLDDARDSQQSLYLLSLDLSKAFDTLEYWSQAMTWRAFGMPKPLVRILLQMDATATTQVALGGGRYTDPIPHGRGVRQGSCGGPLKWIAFMHWWMAGTKARMEGKGYKMSADTPTEFIAQMFVDDSNWATCSAEAMQEMVGLHESWVSLHALGINKKKTDLLVVNAEEGAETINWASGEELTPVSGATPVRYLGAHYQTDGGWEGECEILRNKLREKLDPLKTQAKGCSIAQVRYLINGVIMPSLLHPLKVAGLPGKALRAMDGQIRAAFFSATRMATTDMPKEVVHLPTQLGGWGIHSVEMQKHAQCVSTWSKALNQDSSHMTRRIADALVWAHKQRHEIPSNPLSPKGLLQAKQGTQLGELGAAMGKLGLEMPTSDQELCNPRDSHKCFDQFRRKPALTSPEEAARLDYAHMLQAPRRGHVRAFTDGSLSDPTHMAPLCGWGYYTTWGSTGECERGSGRVMSVPTIFEAESEAVMRVLLSISPWDSVEVFIDNMSVLDLLQAAILRPWQDTTAHTLNTPGRATWARIRFILRHRDSEGGQTEASWVHSHVDKEDRLEVKCTTHRCACHRDSLEGATKCNPLHWTHKGNEEADKEADAGPSAQGPTERWKGELRVFPAPTGQPITGHKLKEVLETAIHKTLLLGAKGKVRAQRIEERNANTDPTLRGRAARTTIADCGERFRTRAAMDILPTYARLAKAVHGSHDNKMRRMYTPEGDTDPIIDEEGKCILCYTAPETIAHVLFDCPVCAHMQFAREQRHAAALSIAHSYGLQDWWKQEDWTLARPGWDPVWGALGQAPRDSWKTALEHGADPDALTKCMSEIQDVMLASAAELWALRNELVLAEEERQGVTDTKKTYENWKKPAPADGTAPKRGRPCLQWEALAPSTKQARRLREDREELDKLHPDACRERGALKIKQKHVRKASRARESQGTLGHLAAPGEGIDPATRGMEALRRYDSKHTRRAGKIGVGSRITVSWPNDNGGQAERWPGTVIAMVPNSNGTSDHIVRYHRYEDESFRHALWAGLTTYAVIGDPCAPECTESCQQGKDECDCEAHEHPHSHPWYCRNSLQRDTCDCHTCKCGDPHQARLVREAKAAGAELPAGTKYHRGPRNFPTAPGESRTPNGRRKKSTTADSQNSTDEDAAPHDKAQRDLERDARAAKRSRGGRQDTGGCGAENPQVGTCQDSPEAPPESLGGSGHGAEKDADGRGGAGSEPTEGEPHQMGPPRGKPGETSRDGHPEAAPLDLSTHQRRPKGNSDQSSQPVEEATRERGGEAGRPDGGNQRAYATDGAQRRAAARPRGLHSPEPILGGTEYRRPGKSLRLDPSARGHHAEIHSGPGKRGLHQNEHGPTRGPRSQDDPLGGEQRGADAGGDSGARSGDPVPHVDSPGCHTPAIGAQLQDKVRSPQPLQPREGSGGNRADGPGTEHSVVHFRMDLPGSVYGGSEVLLAGEWGLGEAWRPVFYAATACSASPQLLQVQGHARRGGDVPGSEGHQDMDKPPGMDPAKVRPPHGSRGSDRRRIRSQAASSGDDEVGSKAMDPRGADMGPADHPPPQAPAGLIKQRGRQLEPDEIKELKAASKRRRQETTNWMNRDLTGEAEASQVPQMEAEAPQVLQMEVDTKGAEGEDLVK